MAKIKKTARRKNSQSEIEKGLEETSSTPSPRRKMTHFFEWDGDTLVVNILGSPSSKSDAIGKPKGLQLRVSVTEAPRFGRATDHMVKFLAKEFGVAVSDIEVVFGRMNVNKQLRIKNPKKLPKVFSKGLTP